MLLQAIPRVLNENSNYPMFFLATTTFS